MIEVQLNWVEFAVMDGFGCCDKKINKLKGKHAKKKSDKERKGKERRIDGKENDKKRRKKKVNFCFFWRKKKFSVFSEMGIYNIYKVV